MLCLFAAVLAACSVLMLAMAAMAGSGRPSMMMLDGEGLQVHREMVDSDLSHHGDALSRHRRYLLFRNNSLLQFTFAYSFPVELLPRRNLIIVLGGQIAFDLPFELKKLTVQTIARDSPDIAQPDAFRAAEAILEQSGLPGRPCVLLAVCQLAETPLEREAGLLEDIIHLMLSPNEGSHPDDWVAKKERKEYFDAERIGKEGVTDCRTAYPKCNVSILEAFTKIILS